jgi:hypothetical protein
MNYSVLSTPMQILLVWTLLGLLLTWLLVFTVLALRSSAREKAKTNDLPTPSRSFPAISAPAALHVITSSPGGIAFPIATAGSVEASSDAGYAQREN